ncbi:MAG: hypothetical protein V1809_03115 [Planctomycetota bacterium]
MNRIALVCFLLASFLGAAGQYLYKAGADRAGASWVSYVGNIRLWAGIVCYIAVMGLFVAAFKRGGAPAILYPVYATTFIWSAVIARMVYGTPIRGIHVAGMVLVVSGVALLARPS